MTGGGTFTRAYSSLPSHNLIYFTLEVWFIDLLAFNSLFDLYVDNVVIQSYDSTYYSSMTSSGMVCGSMLSDYTQKISGKISHNASTITITLDSLLSSSSSIYLGFRNLYLLFETVSSPATSTCDFVPTYSTSSTSCTCSAGQYDASGMSGCTSCNAACQTCSAGTNADCTSCAPGYSFNGQTCFQCDPSCSQCTDSAPTSCIRCNSGEYLYWNGTCHTTCTYPLVNSTDGDNLYCNLPCTNGDDWYANNTCHTGCSFPFVETSYGDLKECLFMCSSSQYLYWTNSCQAACPTSFQYTIAGDNYCAFHCVTNEYLYWNTTCYSTCDSPLLKSNDSQGYNWCNLPCSTGEFLYPNGSCKTQCAYSTPVTPDGVQLCQYPCNYGEFTHDDNSCSATCDSPYTAEVIDSNLTLCHSPCQPNEYYSVSQSQCVPQCDPNIVSQIGLIRYCNDNSAINGGISTPGGSESAAASLSTLTSISNTVSSIGAIIRGNNTSSGFMISLVKLVKYVKYIQVPIEPEVRNILVSNYSDSFSVTTMFYYHMPQSWQDEFTLREIPYAFQIGVGSASYLVNQWETLTTCVFFLGAGLVFLLIEKVIEKTKHKISILIVKRFRIIMTYSFVLFVFFNTYDDLTLFAIIEFMTVKFDSAASIISFLTCIVTSCIAIYILALTMFINTEALKLKSQICDANSIDPQIPFYKRWERYQVLYAGFKNHSFITKSFLFWLTCRVIVTYFFVAFLVNAPLVQTILLTLLSLTMLYSLLKFRPFNDPVNYTVTLLFETLVFVTNIFLVLLAIFDATGTLTTRIQYSLSQAILIVNVIVDISGNIVMWLYILLAMRSAYLTGKEYGASGKTSWLNVLIASYQNPGMDFHDFSNLASFEKENSLTAKQTIKQQFQITPHNYAKIGSFFSLKSVYIENDVEVLTRIRKLTTNTDKIKSADLSDTMDSKMSPKITKVPSGIELKNEPELELDTPQATSLVSPTEAHSRLSGTPFRKNSDSFTLQSRRSSSKILRFSSSGESMIDVKTPRQMNLLDVPNSSGDIINQKLRLLNRKFASEQIISLPLSPSSSNRHTSQNPIIEEFGEALSSRESSRHDFQKRDSVQIPISDVSLEMKKIDPSLKKKRVLRPRTLLSKQFSDSDGHDNTSVDPSETIQIPSKTNIDKSGLEITKRDSEGSSILKKPMINNLDQSPSERQDVTIEESSSHRRRISQLFFRKGSVTQGFLRKNLSLTMQNFKSIGDTTTKNIDL